MSPAPRRVLLVDDEPNVLQGLTRMLRPLRKEWEVATATSGSAALSMFEAEGAFDIIVSDMRMPEMDGASLLAAVKARSPSTLRIVLSGETDVDAATRATPVAHQFLNKPCAPELLIDVIKRAGMVAAALEDPRAREAVGGLSTLPSMSKVCGDVIDALRSEDVSFAELTVLIERDPAIAAKVLHLANASFFGLRRRTSSVMEGITRLGVELLRRLVHSFGLLEAIGRSATNAREVEELQRHALQVGTVARIAAPRKELADDCFVAGLLHDVGKLVCVAATRTGATSSRRSPPPLASDWPDGLGCPPARLGASLLSVWGFPWTVVEAVANFEEEPRLTSGTYGVGGAVYVAHQMTTTATGDDELGGVDAGYAERLGLREKVAAIRAAAAVTASEG
ncbi:MAG: HDOD domain-containing protein [Labilithrix sp.]